MRIKFSYIMLILALAVAGCAAYFSIWGLSQLFAGASTAVIIMASVLEVGKIVTTTALHTYWSRLATTLKIYLTISVGVLMIITSAGIYGFLSNAYQKTANKLEIHEGEVGVLVAKKEIFEKTINENKGIIETKTKRINQLSGLRTNQETRIDKTEGNYSKDRVRRDIDNSNKEIQKLSIEVDELNTKNITLSDSVSKYNVAALELKAGSEIAGEIGPLKYISELTGVPMGNVVNYMILLLIFVFDPLAIALVLATNRVFELEGKQTPLEPNVDIIPYPATPDAHIHYDGTPNPSTPTTILEVIEANNEGVKIDEETGKLNLIYDAQITDEDYILISQSEPQILEESEEEHNDDAVSDAVSDAANEIEPWDLRPIQDEEESTTVSDKSIEVPVYKKEPVITNGKISVEDIKEVKENRGYSVPIPQQKGSNTIERIGSNKHIKDGDNNKFFFKRR